MRGIARRVRLYDGLRNRSSTAGTVEANIDAPDLTRGCPFSSAPGSEMFLKILRGGGPWRFHPGLELLGKMWSAGETMGTMSVGIRGSWHVTQESRLVPQWGHGSCETRPFHLLVSAGSHLVCSGFFFVCDFEVRLSMSQGSQEAAQVSKGSKVRLSLRRRGGRSPTSQCGIAW